MSENTKYEGFPVRIGEKTYTVPAMTVRQVKKHRNLIGMISQFERRDPTEEEFDAVIDFAFDVLSRNYPDLQRDAFEDELDMNSLPTLLEAIAGITQLERAFEKKAQAGVSHSIGRA